MVGGCDGGVPVLGFFSSDIVESFGEGSGSLPPPTGGRGN